MDYFIANLSLGPRPIDKNIALQKLRTVVDRVCGSTHDDEIIISRDYFVSCSRVSKNSECKYGRFTDDTIVLTNGYWSSQAESAGNEPEEWSLLIDSHRAASGDLAVWKAALGGCVVPDRLRHLSGSFNAILHEPARWRTVIVTDRFSTRPLFIFQTDETIWLASDIRLILSLPGVDRAIDVEGLAQLIRTQMILEDRTLYKSIKSIEGGTMLEIDHRANLLNRKQYWTFSYLDPFLSREEAIHETASAFHISINRIIEQAENLCVFLSGGFDSRMIAAVLGRSRLTKRVETRTFGIGLSDEMEVAARISDRLGMRWRPILQTTRHYTTTLNERAAQSNALYSFYHTHTFYPSQVAAEEGFDTALHGWGLDLFFSGSYFPKHFYKVLNRDLTTYQLKRIHTQDDAGNYLLKSIDVQDNDFTRSFLVASLEEVWRSTTPAALSRLLDRSQNASDVPFNWIDTVLFGLGMSKFRSYPMVTSIRAHLKERNPLVESDIINVYRRLPYQWRYLGPVFRRALSEIDPEIANYAYINVGTSPFASPLAQALSLQLNAMLRYRKGQLRRMLKKSSVENEIIHGSYPSPQSVATSALLDRESRDEIRRVFLNGPLFDLGLFDVDRLIASYKDKNLTNASQSLTWLSIITLAYWLDSWQ